MLIVLSGEGPTDLGCCDMGHVSCEGEQFLPGPIKIVLDQLLRAFAATAEFCFVGRTAVEARAKSLKPPRLTALDRPRQTASFVRNARALARIALDLATRRPPNDPIVAVLFRDADKESADERRQAMLDGFELESFPGGVPMIPNATSEAWLICAITTARAAPTPPKPAATVSCQALEGRGAHIDKPELATLIAPEPVTRESLVAKVIDLDLTAITMPSFQRFRDDFRAAVTGQPAAQRAAPAAVTPTRRNRTP